MCGPLTMANEQKLSSHCLPPFTTVCEVTKRVYQIKLRILSKTITQKHHIITSLKVPQQNINAGKHTLLCFKTVFVLLLFCLTWVTEASSRFLHIRGRRILYWSFKKITQIEGKWRNYFHNSTLKIISCQTVLQVTALHGHHQPSVFIRISRNGAVHSDIHDEDVDLVPLQKCLKLRNVFIFLTQFFPKYVITCQNV